MMGILYPRFNRGSYRSAHVVLNLLNELRKRDKMLTFYGFFCNKFNKFNITRPQMLDAIYHMTIELLENPIFGVKRQHFAIFYARL